DRTGVVKLDRRDPYRLSGRRVDHPSVLFRPGAAGRTDPLVPVDAPVRRPYEEGVRAAVDRRDLDHSGRITAVTAGIRPNREAGYERKHASVWNRCSGLGIDDLGTDDGGRLELNVHVGVLPSRDCRVDGRVVR